MINKLDYPIFPGFIYYILPCSNFIGTLIISNQQSAISNQQSVISHQQSVISNQQSVKCCLSFKCFIQITYPYNPSNPCSKIKLSLSPSLYLSVFVKQKAPPEFLPMTLSFVYTFFFRILQFLQFTVLLLGT